MCVCVYFLYFLDNVMYIMQLQISMSLIFGLLKKDLNFKYFKACQLIDKYYAPADIGTRKKSFIKCRT